MELKLGDVQETALIPLACRASETKRKNPRITDEMAVKIVDSLRIETKKYDKIITHVKAFSEKEIRTLRFSKREKVSECTAY